MNIISQHSKKRIIQRTEGINYIYEAKRLAKQAWTAGKTISQYCGCPGFAAYLQTKKDQSRTCNIRIYRDNVYIWKGKSHTLVTVIPIPKRYLKEIEEAGV